MRAYGQNRMDLFLKDWSLVERFNLHINEALAHKVFNDVFDIGVRKEGIQDTIFKCMDWLFQRMDSQQVHALHFHFLLISEHYCTYTGDLLCSDEAIFDIWSQAPIVQPGLL